MRSNSKLLTHADSEIEISMIKGLFEDNGITLLIEKKGTGAYLNVHSGFNFQGSDIYVSEDDYEKAVELLQVIRQDHTDGIQSEDWVEEERTKYEKRKRVSVLFAIIIPVTLLVLVLLGSIIMNFVV